MSSKFSSKKAKYPQDKVFEVASKIAIKYGGFGNRYINLNQDRINEFWGNETNCPSWEYVQRRVSVKTVKWYIYHKMGFQHEIWTSDFLHGLMTHGEIRWNMIDFPSFKWRSNEGLLNLLQYRSPFGGKVRSKKRHPSVHIWINVPALYLKHSKESLEYVAGIMSGAELFTDNGYHYAKFSPVVKPHLEKLGIPVDYTGKRFILISPIWPALFTPKMPLELREQWLHLKNPLKATMYAAILWKTYMDSTFPPKAIPYLRSTRSLFYEFECKEGAMRKIDLLRVETGLSSLGPQVKEMVKLWSEKHEYNKKAKELSEEKSIGEQTNP